MINNSQKELYFLVDDDAIFRSTLGKSFKLRNINYQEASCYDEVTKLLEKSTPTRAVVDLKMPGADGLSVTTLLKKSVPNIKVVVLTGYGSIATAVEAMRCGANNYITKPCTTEDLLHSFESQETSKVTTKRMSLDELEREHVEQVLQDVKGNVTTAAKILGVHRRSLQRKLSRWRESYIPR